jgi:hypothetical protein
MNLMIIPVILQEELVEKASPEKIMAKHAEIAENISASMKLTMADLLQGDLFVATCYIGAIIAAMGLGWYWIDALKKYANNDYVDVTPLIQQSVIALIVLLLLGGPAYRGSLFSQILISGNTFGNSIAVYAIKAAGAGKSKDIISAKLAEDFIERAASVQMTNCSKIPEAEPRKSCLTSIFEKVEALSQPWMSGEDAVWAGKQKKRIQSQIDTLISFAIPAYGASKYVANSVSNGFGLSQILQTLLLLLGTIFSFISETAKVLAMVIAPLFLAISFFPMFSDAFVNWIKGVINIYLAIIIFYTFVGVVARVTLGTGADNALFAAVTAFLSVVFSLGVLGGGAFSLLGAQGRLASAGSTVAGMAITKFAKK